MLAKQTAVELFTGTIEMKKYTVQYVRIEHQVYTLEVEAEDEEHAEELASEAFDGSEDYKVVHAEEFVQDVEEIKP